MSTISEQKERIRQKLRMKTYWSVHTKRMWRKTNGRWKVAQKSTMREISIKKTDKREWIWLGPPITTIKKIFSSAHRSGWLSIYHDSLSLSLFYSFPPNYAVCIKFLFVFGEMVIFWGAFIVFAFRLRLITSIWGATWKLIPYRSDQYIT